MNRLATTAALALAAALPAIPVAAQQSVLLRYAPAVGQVTRYRTVVQTWMRIPGMASDTTRPTMTRTMYQTHTVTAADAATRVVSTVIDSSAQDLGPMNGMMPGGDLFKGMTVTQHVDSLGAVRAFDVTAPPDANPMIAQAMHNQAGERQFLLPDRPVSPGDTWTSSDTMALGQSQGGGHAILALTYKLESVDRAAGSRVATISMSGALHADNAGAPGAIEGQMSGSMTLDLQAGRITHSTTTMTAQVHSPDGSVIPMRSVTTTEVLP